MTEFYPRINSATAQIKEYLAYRKAPSRSAIDIILCEAESVGGMEASHKLLLEYLEKQHETYDAWINKLTGKSNHITAFIFKAMRKLFG